MIRKPSSRNFQGETPPVAGANAIARLFKWLGATALVLFVWLFIAGEFYLRVDDRDRADIYVMIETGVFIVAIAFLLRRRRTRLARAALHAPAQRIAGFEADEGLARPHAMRLFDQLLLLTLAINLITLFQAFPLLKSMTDNEPAFAQAGVAFEELFGGLVFGFLLTIGLWFCTSRLRSNIARWILAIASAHTVLICLVNAPQNIALSPAYFVTGLLGALVSLTATWFLFTPESRVWFAAKRKAEPRAIRDGDSARRAPAPVRIEIPSRPSFGKKVG